MKMYPFSARKHAHDIELVKNRAYNMAYEASNLGDTDKADKCWDLYDRAIELLEAIQDGMQGWSGVTMLTGPMIGSAKEMVLIAAEIRNH